MSVEDPSDHAVDPADEQRHPADPETLWNESHYLDFVAEDGSVAGYVRIGLYPNLGMTWWTAMVVGPDRPVVASVAYDLPIGEGSGLELAAGFEIAAVVEVPLAKLAVRGNVPARSHSEPAAVYRGDIGEATDIGFDLEWTTDGSPYHYLATTRYEVPCTVAGELTVGDQLFTIRSHGQRDHSWGVRDWWAFGWCWAAARARRRDPAPPGGHPHPGSPRRVRIRAVFRRGRTGERRDRARRARSMGHADRCTGANRTRRSRGHHRAGRVRSPAPRRCPTAGPVAFPAAFARFVTDDGRTGTGWIEWNQPEESPARQ